MNSFVLDFRLVDRSNGYPGNCIEIEVSESGDIEGLWIDGHDYSDNGIVIQAVIKMIGERYFQQKVSELACWEKVDALGASKSQKETALETA